MQRGLVPSVHRLRGQQSENSPCGGWGWATGRPLGRREAGRVLAGETDHVGAYEIAADDALDDARRERLVDKPTVSVGEGEVLLQAREELSERHLLHGLVASTGALDENRRVQTRGRAGGVSELHLPDSDSTVAAKLLEHSGPAWQPM